MRIEKLSAKLEKLKINSFIFTNRSNIFYFSGYTGEGMLVYIDGELTIVTDFRYVVQAEKEAPDLKVFDIGTGTYAKALKSVLSGVRKAGFEADDITVNKFEQIKSELQGKKFIPTKGIGINIRSIKDESEIQLLKKAASATQDGWKFAYKSAAFGMTENDLSTELEYYLKKNYGASKAFDFIVAAGENGSMPHAITGERKLSDGDMVTLDFGAKIKNYNSDMTRTFSMGRPSVKMKEIYSIVCEAQREAQLKLKPGMVCREIDKIARDIIIKHGYGEFFGHGTGHGVGIDIHEEPRLNTLSETVLKEGMVVTVEPGIYVPGLGGVRIENTCVITKGGYESFFDASTDLNIIDGGKL